MNSKGNRVGYIRVSTIDQNTERQLDGIQLDEVFTEKCSGKSLERPQLQAMLKYVRKGDTVIVHSLDRLGRNRKHLHEIIDELLEKKVQIEFLKENLKLIGKECPTTNLMLGILTAFSQFEVEKNRERQLEGIAIAKAKGKYKGGKKKLNPLKIEELKKALEQIPKSKSQLAREMGIHRTSLRNYERYIKQQQTA